MTCSGQGASAPTLALAGGPMYFTLCLGGQRARGEEMSRQGSLLGFYAP